MPTGAQRQLLAVKDALKVFSVAYGLHICLSIDHQILRRRPTVISLLRAMRCPSPLPALFPALLRNLHAWLTPLIPETSKPFVLAPLLLLLPRHLRVQVGTWGLSWAVIAFVKRKDKREGEEGGPNGEWRSEALKIAIAAAGNAWILWATLFEDAAGTEAYSRLLLQSAPYYAPPRPKSLRLDEKYPKAQEIYASVASISKVAFPPYPVPPAIQIPEACKTVTAYYPVSEAHRRLLCAVLHPGEPDCMENAVRAWVDCCERFFKYLVGYMTLREIAKKGHRALTEPFVSVLQILKSTVLGTIFLAGSCTTAWSLTCLLQTALPPTSMPRTRWILNSVIGSLWLLVVPPRRREDITVYTARAALISIWKVGERRGMWKGIRNGEVLLFAISWSVLSWIKQEDGSLGGLCGRLMTWIDGIPERKGR